MADYLNPTKEFLEALNEDEIGALVPEGANGQSAKSIFEERKYYKTAVYPNKFVVPIPLDLWYDRTLFGKLDLEGNSVFPFKTSMKQLIGENPNVWVFDFVADAFNDFKTIFLFTNKKDVAGTPFESLNPQRGWKPTVVEYDKYMDAVYDRFAAYVSQTNRDKEVVSFDKFMDVFYDFINIQSPRVPITLSQYIVSPLCSPTTSGLMVDISLDLHGNDKAKYLNFIDDRNFICYAETAQQFGFKVDKNFPGRLIADLSSPVMNRDGDPALPPSQGGRGYMRKYPKKPAKFIKKPPAEPQRKPSPPQPTSYPQNPFDDGDQISFLIARKRTSVGYIQGNVEVPSDYDYLILRDYTTLEQRGKPAGLKQKTIDQGGITSKGLEVLKIHLNALGYEAPKRISGRILRLNITQAETAAGGGEVCVDNNGRIVACPPPPPGRLSAREAVQSMMRRAGVSGANDTMVVHFSQDASGIHFGAQSSERVRGISFENIANATAGDTRPHRGVDGLSYGMAVVGPAEQRDVYLELPYDAAHMSAKALASQIKKFENRTSYPAKLQKYTREVAENERLYRLKWNAWHDQAMPDYRKIKLANKQAWNYYRNPSNRLTVNNVFNKRYRKSYLEDMSMLKEICMQFYYSYIKDNPIATVTKLVRENGGAFLTKTKVIQREQISQSLIRQKYPEPYWIKQYILMRNAESENKKTFHELRLLRRRVMKIYEQEGLHETLKYIKEKMPAKAYESVMDLR